MLFPSHLAWQRCSRWGCLWSCCLLIFFPHHQQHLHVNPVQPFLIRLSSQEGNRKVHLNLHSVLLYYPHPTSLFFFKEITLLLKLLKKFTIAHVAKYLLGMAYLFLVQHLKYKIKKTITLEGGNCLDCFLDSSKKKCCFVNLFHKGFVLFRFSPRIDKNTTTSIG